MTLPALRSFLASALLLSVAACSPTRITFDGPPNTVLFVNSQPHHLPAQVEFLRPAGNGQSNRYELALVFTSPTAGEIRATGFAEVYGFTESEVDRAVNNTCKLSDDELANLVGGKTLVYKISTASRQPLATLTFSRK